MIPTPRWRDLDEVQPMKQTQDDSNQAHPTSCLDSHHCYLIAAEAYNTENHKHSNNRMNTAPNSKYIDI